MEADSGWFFHWLGILGQDVQFLTGNIDINPWLKFAFERVAPRKNWDWKENISNHFRFCRRATSSIAFRTHVKRVSLVFYLFHSQFDNRTVQFGPSTYIQLNSLKIIPFKWLKNVTNKYFRKINLLQRKLNYWQIASKPKKMQKRSDLLESFLDKNTLCHSCDIFNIMWHSCQLWQICDKGVTPYLTELFETYYMCDYTV